MSLDKQIFKGFVNQIAVDLGLITSAQQAQILETQAKFAALAEKGIRPTAKFLDADPLFAQVRDGWDGLAAKHGISADDLTRNLEKAKSGNGFSKDDAPASGDIAGALKFVSKDAKNAILTAQAAVRAEQALVDIDNPNAKPKSPEDIAKQHGRIDVERKFDPEELVQAQITNKKADQLHADVKSGAVSLEDLPALREALVVGVDTAYKNANQMFDKLTQSPETSLTREVSATSVGQPPKEWAR